MKTKPQNNPYSHLFPEVTPVDAETQFKKLMIAEDLLILLEDHGITRTELATRMGVSPSRVTSMLTGTNNFTVESLVRSARALESDWHHCFAPMGKKVRWCFYDKAEVHPAFAAPINRTEVQHRDIIFKLDPIAPDDDSNAA